MVFAGGVKFGRSGTLNSRLRTYFAPWCRRVHAVVAISWPASDLVRAEAELLRLADTATEFAHGCSKEQAIHLLTALLEASRGSN